ncbi:hypothetical protein [Citrobacter koseri]|uniref:hypothetical protein n=1 Tax=Citrobacter koseri TaxID=545 RepID=UPI000D9DE2BE|nr:hypothetical protein [Citrobacter koseri]SQB09203.1 Uncharacterised protein [Citrobacter koseri]STB47766.1 Uncharacterised protein [Citrobacter koseri]
MKSTVETKIIELVKLGHERAADLKASCGAVDVRTVAQLVSDLATQLEVQLVRSNALAAENAELIRSSEILLHEASEVYRAYNKTQLPDGDLVDEQSLQEVYDAINATPTTDAFLAEVQSKAREEGAYFVANRMLAAWDAGFIDDTASNAADIARMILTSTEFMADAPEGDFDRSFADGVLKDIAAQLRKGVQS